MRNLLLLAKYKAYSEGKKNIGVMHIKYALKKCYNHLPNEIDLIKYVGNELHIGPTIEELNYDEIYDNIKSILKIDKYSYTKDAKQIVERLKSYGLSSAGFSILPEVNMMHDYAIEEDDYIFDDDSISKAITIQNALKEKIYGQDMAIEAVVDSVKNTIIEPISSPKMTFLFLGPPATGKTYLAKLIAQNFQGYNFLELNMQLFSDDKSGLNIFGSEAKYSNSSPGELTQFVRSNPKSVILFDEFEKAHTTVQKKLLTIFSEGYLNDLNGWIYDEEANDYVSYDSTNEEHKKKTSEIVKKVDFTQTIIIFTSNLGHVLYNNHEFLDCMKTDYEKAETMILDALQKEKKREANEEVQAIVPEMISRLSQAKIVLFNKLSFEDLLHIADNIFEQKINELMKKYKLNFVKDEHYRHFLKCSLLRFAPYMDVRRIKSKIYENIIDGLTDYMLKGHLNWKDINEIKLNVSQSVLDYFSKNIDDKIKDKSLIKYLFRKNFTFNYEYTPYRQGDIFTLTIDNCKFEKVKNVEDMLGTGALSFNVPDIRFEDIAGHDSVKSRLIEIAHLLKEPEKLKKFGAKTPKGMLLYGVPGTGKTMLAKAFANYANLPFIETTANDLIDLGSGNLEVMKKVFNRARDYSPSIVFIDEIDTFGSREQNGSKALINELLTQINGFSDNIEETIFIIAATNYKDSIDPAILRPGRIELHVEIPTLDAKGREYFITKMLKKPSESNISIQKLVMYTAGMTGAQLEKISNESSLYAIRHGLNKLTEELIIEQINIEKYGKKIQNKSIEESLKETAYHEAGHAVISKILNPKVKIEQITVTAREDTLGFVAYNMEDSQSNPSKQDLQNHICIAYAGRIAQMKQFGMQGLDTGASSDLAHATRLAYLMVAKLGMDDIIGYININGIKSVEPTNYNFMQKEIDTRVKEILTELKTKTEQLVDANWEYIESLANLLLKQEVVHEDEINTIITKA